jgi:predicted transcriptional regulator
MSEEEESATQVSKFMTKPVITADVDQTIKSICKTMYENNIGSVVIVKRQKDDSSEPVGIITESDIIRKMGSVELFSTQTAVSELMSKNIISIKSDSKISDAIGVMHGNNIRRLIVVDNNGKMLGIITDKDMLKAIARKKSITSAYIPKEFDIKD